MKIEYNPETGILEAGVIKSEFPNSISNETLFTSMEAGACVALVEYSAFQLNSLYNHDLVTRQKPIIDGVVLRGTHSGGSAKIASVKGYKYIFDTPILEDLSLREDLYLSKNGYLTFDIPSLVNGDKWFVYIGRKVNDYSFIFDPHDPLDLLNPGSIVIPSPVPDPAIDKIILNEAMAALTCFKLNNSGQAVIVSTSDLTIPLIDGITLESGGIGAEVKVGRLKNQSYTTPIDFTSSDIYWLTNTGIISKIRNDTDSFVCMVGRSVGNSNKFIFDPQLPIRMI